MKPADLEALQSAVTGLNDRRLDPFVGLLSDDMTWTGVPRGLFWWRHRPT